MQNEKLNRSSQRHGLGREATIKIAQQLRTMYDETIKEGIPERFVELLKRMDKGGNEGSR
jgi:hypothetical protein